MRAKYRVKKLPFPGDYRVRDRAIQGISADIKKAPEALIHKAFGSFFNRVNFRVIIVSEIHGFRAEYRVKALHGVFFRVLFFVIFIL